MSGVTDPLDSHEARGDHTMPESGAPPTSSDNAQRVSHNDADRLLPGSAPVKVLRITRRTTAGDLYTSLRLAAAGPYRGLRRDVGWWVLLAGALAAWLMAQRQVDLDALGNWGLLGQLPSTWYVVMAGVLLLFALHVVRPVASPWVLGALIGVVVLILYATPPLLEETPRYSWVYKHIGVARYIAETGTVDPEIDIYHRWPGFFAAAATLSEISGVGILTLARGAESFFALVNAVLVAALARTFSADLRLVATTSLLFSLGNFVGQGYFAPQALGFTMGLTSVLVALRFLSAEPNRLGLAAQRSAASILRKAAPVGDVDIEPVAPRRPGHRERRLAIGIVLALHAAVVVTHQLTPYVLLLGLGSLFLLGRLRPMVLVVGLAAMTGLYLLPNLDFVVQKFGIFTGANPLENVALGANTDPVLVEKLFRNKVSLVLQLTMLALAAAGLVQLGRRTIGRAVTVGCLMASPVLLLLSQNYGGEARHRVYLFMLPWVSFAAASLLLRAATLRRPTARRFGTALAGLTIGLVAAASVISNFGDEDLIYIPPAEVAAFESLYRTAQPGTVFVMGAPGSPARLTASYPLTVAADGTTPTLADAPDLNIAEVPDRMLAARIDEYLEGLEPRQPLLIFSARQYRYAEVFDVVGTRGLGRVEDAVRKSGRFTQVFDNGGVRAYRSLY